MKPASADFDRDELCKLLSNTGAQDQSAFAQLYSKTSSRLGAVVYRIVHNRETTDDILQEVFLKIWSKADQFDSEKAAPLTWMASIARNTAIDYVRQNQRNVSIMADSPDDESFVDLVERQADEAPGPLQSLADVSDAKQLAQCLENLDESVRDSIMNAYFEGLSYTEVAESMAEPVGTVRSWIRRGMKKLRGCLQTSLSLSA